MGCCSDLATRCETYWFAEGRPATRPEIMASIAKGLPLLREKAGAEGAEAMQELDRYIERAMPLVPA